MLTLIRKGLRIPQNPRTPTRLPPSKGVGGIVAAVELIEKNIAPEFKRF